MAPLTWKLLLATIASGQHCSQSETCEDQTALLQSHLASHKSNLQTTAESLNFPRASNLIDPKKRKMALAQFEDTAMELAQNRAGVTDVVVQVCNETSELLRDTVMSAIVSEHDTDQAMLDTAWNARLPIEEQRVQYLAEIDAAIAVVYGEGGWIEQHVNCRTFESERCVQCGECRAECDDQTSNCDDLEARLRLRYVDVINTVTTPAYCDEHLHIHPPTSDTTVTIAEHHANKEAMEEYIAALAAFEACEVTVTTVCTSCPDIPTQCNIAMEDCPCLNHTITRTDCNSIQQSLQNAQCDARHEVSGYLQLYQQAFESARSRYYLVESQIRIMEADRKVEWRVLTKVICLLNTLSVDEDGSASSVDTANRIDACENDFVDTSHLDIEYYVWPPMGELRDIPLNPCSDDFENDAYDGVPTPCGGNDELMHEFEHGLITECSCSAEPPTAPEIGFPYELGPFLLFDTDFTLNSAEGVIVSEGMESWEAVFEGTHYDGKTSPFAAVTLPDLDVAFGLEGDDVPVRMAWAYPSPQGTADMIALHGETYPETIKHRFLRTGGFVYLNAAGNTVALKEISPADAALTTALHAELTLQFGRPQGITNDQATTACPGGFKEVTLGSLHEAGALEYCWDKSLTLDICPHGCFTFKTDSMEGFGYLAFPVTAPTDHLAPDHYAATDQQGADPSSMETGQGVHVDPPNMD